MIARSLYLAALPIATGILLALAMPPADLSWLVWIALVPIGLAMTEKRGQVELYLGAYAAGAVFQWIHCDWMRTVTSGATLSYGRQGQWIAQGLAFALPWPIMLWVGRVWMQRQYARAVLVLPIVWVGFEYTRWYGGWLLDLTGFPWGQIGLALHDFPRLMQVASLAGVFGVGALVAMVNGALVDCLRGKGSAPIVAAALVLGTCAAYGQWQLGHEFTTGPSVCLMPADNKHEKVMDELRAAPKLADILLWSEEWFPEIVSAKRNEIATLQTLADDTGSTLAVGCTRKEPGKAFNSVAVVVPHRPFPGFYDKIMLVPFSEFHPPHMPSFDSPVENRLTRGTAYPVFDTGSSRVSALICYDVCFPMTARQLMLADEPPDFFVVSSFEAHDTTGCVQRGTLRHARFRAIECRRAMVRNVIGGVSGAIDGNGQIVSEFDSLTSPTSVGPMPIDDRRSLYAICGDWLPRGCLLVIAAMLCVRGVRGIESRWRRPSTPPAL